MSKIIYTKTDEAPALATVSLLPILKAYSKTSGIKFETRDISLSSRILATFNDFLGSKVKYENDLEFLGKLVKDPDANIIKLPNISASIPQLKKAIKELQTQGFNIPDYPEKIENDIRFIFTDNNINSMDINITITFFLFKKIPITPKKNIIAPRDK